MLCSVAFPSDHGFTDSRVLPPWSVVLLFCRHAYTHESQGHLKPQEQVSLLLQWRLTAQEKEEDHLNTQSVLEDYQCSVPAPLSLCSCPSLPILSSFFYAFLHLTYSLWLPHTSGLSAHGLTFHDTSWYSSSCSLPELLHLINRSSWLHNELLSRSDLICFFLCTLCFDQSSGPINISKYLKAYWAEIKVRT